MASGVCTVYILDDSLMRQLAENGKTEREVERGEESGKTGTREEEIKWRGGKCGPLEFGFEEKRVGEGRTSMWKFNIHRTGLNTVMENRRHAGRYSRSNNNLSRVTEEVLRLNTRNTANRGRPRN